MTPQKLDGYASPVRAVSWHPSGTLLTTCTQDGKIVIWDMTQSPPKKEKVLDGIIPVAKDDKADEFSYDCSVVWHPSGHHFYVASKGHGGSWSLHQNLCVSDPASEIVTISRSDWSRVSGSFSDKNAVGAVTALALSPNGVYLLSSSKSTVFVWSTATRRVVTSHAGTQGATITQIAFSPQRNLIAWTDSEGGLTRWLDPISSSYPDPIKTVVGTKSSAPTTIKRKPEDDLFGDDANSTLEADVDLGMEEDEETFDIDNDWMVDDMNGALNDDPVEEPGAKHMGACDSLCQNRLADVRLQ